MPTPRYLDFNTHFKVILQSVQDSARPGPIVSAALALTGNHLRAGLTSYSVRSGANVFMVALGKAAIEMAPAGWEILGDRLTSGLVTLLPGTRLETPPSIQTFQCGHPLPDAGSIAAGKSAADMLANTRPGDILIALISGGGSAMFELPASGISLENLQDLNQALLASGIEIQEVNTVRQAISQIKAGGLARLAAPAQTISIILSDVVGNQVSKIASGPTVLRPASKTRAQQVLKDKGLWSEVPESVRNALKTTPPKRRPAPRPVNVIAASNHKVVEVARNRAKALGYHTKIVTRQMNGKARRIGAQAARQMLHSNADRPTCFLWGGETTVEVTGQGRGGRNQELALSAALALSGSHHIALMTYATDGIDGPTDAAGAIVTGETITAIQGLGLDPEAHLRDNDAYPPLSKVGALIRTGPTGTNLNDLVVGLAYPLVH